jgi:hypothetical protein
MGSGAPRTVTIIENINSLTFSQLCICKISWEAILENSTPAFRDMQKRPDFLHSSCAVWFHGVFTEKIFAVYPEAKQQYNKSTMECGPHFVSMITCCIDDLWAASRHLVTENVAGSAQRVIASKRPSMIGNDFSIRFLDILINSLLTVTGRDLSVKAIVAWQQLYHVRLRDDVLLFLERPKNHTDVITEQEIDDIINTTYLQASMTNHADLWPK